MENSRERYYNELLRPKKYCNDRNNAPLSNDNIWYAIHKVIPEEELDAYNVTVDTLSQMSNTQRENSDTIFTSDKLYESDDLAETLKYLTINDAEYYVSDLANTIDAKDNPENVPKTVTHTSDRNKKGYGN